MAIARVLTALIGGFLFGCFVHLWALDDAARAAIAAGGISLFTWSGQYVSEMNALRSIFYGLFLLLWLGLVGIYSVSVGLSLRRRPVSRFRRAQIVELWWVGIAAFGAFMAISFNQRYMTATYIDAAEPGSYLAATIGFGLPAMQTLTAAWQRGLLAFVVLLGIVGGVARWGGAAWGRGRRAWVS